MKNNNFALAREALKDIRSTLGANSEPLDKLHSAIDNLEQEYTNLANRYEQQSGFYTLAENSNDFVVQISLEGEYLYANLAYREAMRLDLEDIVGKTNLELGISSEINELFAAIRTRVKEQGKIEDFEFSELVDDERHYFHEQIVPIIDNMGHVQSFMITTREITENKQVLEKLQTRQEQFATLVENIPDGFIYQFARKQGGGISFPYISDNIREIIGISREEIENDPTRFLALVHKEDVPGLDAASNYSKKTLSRFDAEMRFFTTTGDMKWFHCRSTPRRLNDDTVIWDGVAIDITDRKQLEDELVASEANYRAVAEQFPNGIVGLYDRELRYKLVGGRGLAANGLSPEFFEGKRLRDVMPPEVYERDEPALIAALDGQTVEATVPYNGRSFRVVTSPIIHHDNHIVGGIVMTQDITHQVVNESNFKTLFETASIGILLVNPDGSINLANRSACEILGYTAKEISELNLESIVPERFHSAHTQHMASYFANPRTRMMGQGLELSARRKDGSIFPIEVSLSMLETGNGKQVAAFITDITERKLAEANQLALAIEQQKVAVLKQFIQDASHDFRTPLSTILSSTHILKKQSHSTEFLSRIQKIEKQGLHLQNLFEDMFLLLELELDSHVTWDEVDINTILAAQIRAFQHQAEQKQLDLQYTPLSDSIRLIAHLRILDVAFSKIIENAISYTAEQGRIRIHYELQQDKVLVYIEDTGIGISDDDLPHIFKRFYRADKARNLETGGSGLGLAIAQHIIEFHQGKIHIETELGKGTTVIVELPISTVHHRIL